MLIGSISNMWPLNLYIYLVETKHAYNYLFTDSSSKIWTQWIKAGISTKIISTTFVMIFTCSRTQKTIIKEAVTEKEMLFLFNAFHYLWSKYHSQFPESTHSFYWEFLWIIPTVWQVQDLEDSVTIPKSSFLLTLCGLK